MFKWLRNLFKRSNDKIDIDVYRRLYKLGNTSDEVAISLEQRGVKGRIRCADECPIARYLKQQFQHAYDIAVCSTHIDMQFDDNHVEIDEIPPAITCFIRKFDNREYESLVEEDACLSKAA